MDGDLKGSSRLPDLTRRVIDTHAMRDAVSHQRPDRLQEIISRLVRLAPISMRGAADRAAVRRLAPLERLQRWGETRHLGFFCQNNRFSCKITPYLYGELERARDHMREGLRIYDPEKHKDHALNYGGHDPGVCAKGQGSVALWLLGYPDQAARSADKALALAQSLKHIPSLAHALLWKCAICDVARRDQESARQCSDRLLALATEQGLALYLAVGTIVRGWILVHLERLIGSIRRECTGHLLVFNAEHLRRILAKYATYYNEVRTHGSLGKDAPCRRPVERFGDIVANPVLGGLRHRYARI